MIMSLHEIQELERKVREAQDELVEKKNERLKKLHSETTVIYVVKKKETRGTRKFSYVYAQCSSYAKAVQIANKCTGYDKTYKIQCISSTDLSYEDVIKLDTCRYSTSGYISD
jgi:hypothetical protein